MVFMPPRFPFYGNRGGLLRTQKRESDIVLDLFILNHITMSYLTGLKGTMKKLRSQPMPNNYTSVTCFAIKTAVAVNYTGGYLKNTVSNLKTK